MIRRAKRFHDSAAASEILEGGVGGGELGVREGPHHLGEYGFLPCPPVPPAATTMPLACSYEVYSTSIKANLSYLAAEGDPERTWTTTNPSIDPFDSVQVFYTPALRRIHQSIVLSDHATRTRCGGLNLPLPSFVAHGDGIQCLL